MEHGSVESKGLEGSASKQQKELFEFPKGTSIPKEKRFVEVLPRLYLSSLVCAQNQSLLQKHEITHILHVGTANEEYKFKCTQHSISMPDDDLPFEKFRSYIEDAIKFISSAKEGKLLVHCVMGSTRSPTILAAYIFLTKQLNLSLLDTFLYIKEKAPWIWPSETFFNQILEVRGCAT